MSEPQERIPSNRRIIYVILTLAGGAIAAPLLFITWLYISWSYGDEIAERLGLVPPDEHCMIESWEPENEMDVDPREFCDTTLPRNRGSVVDLERRRGHVD